MDILKALLSFFVTIVLLLILFNNCYFSFGCGKTERMTNPAPISQIMMQELSSCDGPLAPPEPFDGSNNQASIEASGDGQNTKLPPLHTPKMNDLPDIEKMPPYGPPFQGLKGIYHTNIGGKGFGRVLPY